MVIEHHKLNTSTISIEPMLQRMLGICTENIAVLIKIFGNFSTIHKQH